MMRVLKLVLAAVFVSVSFCPALAWWDEGHMQIAYIAYTKLEPAVKTKVDALIKMNPDYRKWVAAAPDDETAKAWAFTHAATWADDIKDPDHLPKFTDDKDEFGAIAHQNVGYDDLNTHKYWHFKDVLFSPDGTPYQPIGATHADAVTALQTMITALPELSGAAPGVRSYDLVWIIHVVGDLHQPLHAITRFTKEIPSGDGGANAENVIPATGDPIVLHFYWDGMFGSYASSYGAIYDAKNGGLMKVAVDKGAAAVLDPAKWAEESADLAEKFGYADPVSPGKNPVLLTRDYETNARNLAKTQAALAAQRLANVLNAALK